MISVRVVTDTSRVLGKFATIEEALNCVMLDNTVFQHHEEYQGYFVNTETGLLGFTSQKVLKFVH